MADSAKKTSWEPVAKWYDEHLAQAGTYQSTLILPNLLRLLPPKGRRILDIACGQGFFSRAYAEGGAQVLGVDISPELIKLARERALPGLRFEVAPAHSMSKAKSASFDGALIVLALQNIREMPEAIAEASRALQIGGTLVIVMNHPAFRIPKASSWQWDMEQKTQYRRIDRYGIPHAIEIDMTPGTSAGGNKAFTTSFHRPLQDYFKALAKAGFSVTGLEEWISPKKSEPGPRAAAEDAARKEFPLFLALVAQKDS